MILRGRFTARRKALLALVLVVMAWLVYAYATGVAITRGIEEKDMDWNSDGVVSREEIFQAFYAVTVSDTVQGNRHCRSYAWKGSGEQFRVDCKTVFNAAEK